MATRPNIPPPPLLSSDEHKWVVNFITQNKIEFPHQLKDSCEVMIYKVVQDVRGRQVLQIIDSDVEDIMKKFKDLERLGVHGAWFTSMIECFSDARR